jgi:uncharacterized membrane protein YfhO
MHVILTMSFCLFCVPCMMALCVSAEFVNLTHQHHDNEAQAEFSKILQVKSKSHLCNTVSHNFNFCDTIYFCVTPCHLFSFMFILCDINQILNIALFCVCETLSGMETRPWDIDQADVPRVIKPQVPD